jgi:hypothetical protein
VHAFSYRSPELVVLGRQRHLERTLKEHAMFRPLITAALMGIAATGSAMAAPVAAPSEKVNMVIIYGEDKCPVSKGDEITVCARKAESERYRIPEPFRDNPKGPQNEAWSQRVIAYERVGATGPQSCSAVGAGGATGCLSQFINNAYAEKKASSDVQFSKMIQAEREKRLATVDDEAAKTQSDVEDAERAYDARKKKQAEDDAKAKAATHP